MGKVIWLTGIPDAGKTTIALSLQEQTGCEILDGDDIRKTPISEGLGFSKKDRHLHLMRVAYIAKRLQKYNHVVCAFVSPYRKTRQAIRDYIGGYNFLEVWVDCPVEVAKDRDNKGLYKAAKTGGVSGLTSKSLYGCYEPPESPEIYLNTDGMTLDWCVRMVVDALRSDDNL